MDENISGNERVGLIMNERIKMDVKKYELVSARLLWVCMKIGIHMLMIATCDSPVNGANESTRDEFWGKACNNLNKCNSEKCLC